MIAAMVWKEYREQRGVWLTLAFLGLLSLAVLPLAYKPEPIAEKGFREALLAIALALAWTHALVCGAMLLAGEEEAGTQAMLDALPAPRLGLWLGKLTAGVALVAAQVIVLTALATSAEVVEPAYRPFVGLILAALGAHGLSWGMLCSARARTVLGAVGLAVLANPAAALVLACPLSALAYLTGLDLSADVFLALVVVLATLLPLPLSAFVYTRLDRARRVSSVVVEGPGQRVGPWHMAVWLAWRQTRGLMAGLLLFALIAGCFVIGRGLILWPVLTVGIGAVCGVSAFLDEQNGAYRFLGDQRFPLTRLWLVKVGGRLALGLLALVVMLLPLAVISAARAAFRSGEERHLPLLVSTLGGPVLVRSIPLGLFFVAPMMTGLAVGHLFGLIFRKALVALVVSVGVALLLVAVWWPSVIAGGLQGWQILGVVPVLLGGALLLLPYWAGDRLLSWGAVWRVGGAWVLALALIAAGLWYRAVEVPDVDEPDDFAPWLASLPTPETNEAGRLVRGGLAQLDDVRRTLQNRRPTRSLFADGAPAGAQETFGNQARLVAEQGWPADGAELGVWLDEVFNHDWHRSLARAAPLRLGLVEDPRRFTSTATRRTYDVAQVAGALLAARGLQRQKMNEDPEAFVGHFQAGLALARNLGHNSTQQAAWYALDIERGLLLALERWLESLGGREDLLRRALVAVRAHGAAYPDDERATVMAEYLIAKEGMEETMGWMWAYDAPVLGFGSQENDREVIRGAWSAPWERVRRERLLRLAFWDRERLPAQAFQQLFLVMPNPNAGRGSRERLRERAECRRAAAQLQLAIGLFQAEKGRAPAALVELVPAYLSAVPKDPFDGRPFRYRVSKGETIFWPGQAKGQAAGGRPAVGAAPDIGEVAPLVEPTRLVLAGQGVLWSVGDDKADGGGRRQGRGEDVQARSSPGEDLIWLVPVARQPLPPRPLP